MNLFFVDAETDGLYGGFLSIAVIVTDDTGNEIERFYGAVDTSCLKIESDWVKENVVPQLRCAELFFADENDLMDAFWNFWIKHRSTCLCIADVSYPVEARLFNRCVEKNVNERIFLGPYPLLDLSTMLLAKGINPDEDRKKLSGLELKRHDALDDVRMAAKIWINLMK